MRSRVRADVRPWPVPDLARQYLEALALLAGLGALAGGLLTWLIDGHLGWPPSLFWLPFALSATLLLAQSFRQDWLRRHGDGRVEF